jgi:hypothetical protein
VGVVLFVTERQPKQIDSEVKVAPQLKRIRHYLFATELLHVQNTRSESIVECRVPTDEA